MVGLLVALAAAATAPGAATDLLLPPKGEGGAPVVVQVGFHVIDFARVTAREETFDLTGYLELRWTDPRLAGREGPPQGRIWTPRVNFDNAVEAPRPHAEPDVEIGPGGRVSSRTIFSGKFTARMDLRPFPFDTQELPVRASLLQDESAVRFEAIPGLMAMHDDASMPDWVVGSPAYRVESHRYAAGRPGFSELVYTVAARRRATFYLWRVLLPLTVLSVIPFMVFWFEPMNLQPQISTCMATLIALLTFGYAVDLSLPKLTYLTLLDRHAILGVVFTAVAALLVTLVHRAAVDGGVEKAVALQRPIRLWLPLTYLIASAANLAATLALRTA
jgi:hypothetical protein